VVESDTEAPEEQPARPPGRAGVSLRDMVGSVAVLLLLIAAVVGFSKGCSFSPGRPSVDPKSVPTADASRELAAAASSVDFSVRLPNVPKDWHPNSASTAPVGSGGHVVVRVGWLTPQGHFVQLSQSGATPVELVTADTDRDEPASTGTVDVAGTTWTVYPGRRDEQAWVTKLPGATVLVTGTGGEDEFRALATAVRAATPLPRS
jgi:hypothetical protein